MQCQTSTALPVKLAQTLHEAVCEELPRRRFEGLEQLVGWPVGPAGGWWDSAGGRGMAPFSSAGLWRGSARRP
jgi:hypothetical protein